MVLLSHITLSYDYVMFFKFLRYGKCRRKTLEVT